MLAAADLAREDVLPKANQPPIVKLGRKLLSESGWAALPDDKGGGYTLVASSDMLPLVEKVLSSGMYVKLERHFTLHEKLLKVARALASRIQTFGGRGWSDIRFKQVFGASGCLCRCSDAVQNESSQRSWGRGSYTNDMATNAHMWQTRKVSVR